MTKRDESDRPSGAMPKPEHDANGLRVTRRGFVAAVGAGAAGVAVLSLGDRAEAAKSTTPPPAPTPIYRIHPAIGVVRYGNLDPEQGFVVGPEVPGYGPTDGLSGNPVAQHKLGGLIKPQAARFRVFEYARNADGKLYPKGEVLPQTATRGTPFVKAITWKVHLANRKASFYVEDGPIGETKPAGDLRNPTIADRASLESDFGPRTISGKSVKGVVFSPTTGGSYPVRKVRDSSGAVLIDYLGQLRTDAAGRLLVFGGKGRSASSISPAQVLSHWSNNNFWFDDGGDGPVTATVTLDDGYGHTTDVPMDAAGNAWVLGAPPDFSPGIQAATSLYDTLYDLAVREMAIPTDNALYDDGGPLARLRQLAQAWDASQDDPTSTFEFGDTKADYASEIWPLVLNAVNYVYTTALVNFKHLDMLTDPLSDPSDASAAVRKTFFSYLRAPGDAATNTNGPATMPRLYGDNWYIGNSNFVYSFGQDGTGNAGGGAIFPPGSHKVPKYQRYCTITATQYGLLRAWKVGNFTPPASAPSPPPAVITAHGLDRAALENCVGAPFYPGLEAGWQIRNPALFAEPFRLSHAATSQFLLPSGAPEGTTITAGHFSRQMALPWQADFNDCSKLLNLGWWPSARPDDVFLHVGDKLSDRVPWMRPDASKWPSGSTSASYEDMVVNWYKLGFLKDEGGGFYIESERNSSVP